MYFWHALCAAFIFGSLKSTLPPESLMPPLPTRCGSGMSMPWSRMHLENFRAPSKALSCPEAPFGAVAAVVGTAARAERQGSGGCSEDEW